MTIELKPCPAGHSDVRIYAVDSDLDDGYRVVCGNRHCPWDIDMIFPTDDAAIAAWNTRAESEEVERLRADLLDCATMIRRMQRVIRKYNKNDKLVATASEFLRRKRLAGSLLRETDLAQPPEES